MPFATFVLGGPALLKWRHFFTFYMHCAVHSTLWNNSGLVTWHNFFFQAYNWGHRRSQRSRKRNVRFCCHAKQKFICYFSAYFRCGDTWWVFHTFFIQNLFNDKNYDKRRVFLSFFKFKSLFFVIVVMTNLFQ